MVAMTNINAKCLGPLTPSFNAGKTPSNSQCPCDSFTDCISTRLRIEGYEVRNVDWRAEQVLNLNTTLTLIENKLNITHPPNPNVPSPTIIVDPCYGPTKSYAYMNKANTTKDYIESLALSNNKLRTYITYISDRLTTILGTLSI
jgi:hypothetical protein